MNSTCPPARPPCANNTPSACGESIVTAHAMVKERRRTLTATDSGTSAESDRVGVPAPFPQDLGDETVLERDPRREPWEPCCALGDAGHPVARRVPAV